MTVIDVEPGRDNPSPFGDGYEIGDLRHRRLTRGFHESVVDEIGATSPGHLDHRADVGVALPIPRIEAVRADHFLSAVRDCDTIEVIDENVIALVEADRLQSRQRLGFCLNCRQLTGTLAIGESRHQRRPRFAEVPDLGALGLEGEIVAPPQRKAETRNGECHAEDRQNAELARD